MRPLLWILTLWACSRLILLACGWLSLEALPSAPGLNYTIRPWLSMWSHFDSNWYLKIATQGYSPGYLGTAGYFPGYPWLVRLWLPWADPLLAAVLTSHGMLLLALGMFWRLLRLDLSLQRSQRVLMLLVSFPSAFFFSLVYAESSYLFFCCLAFYLARRGWPASSGLAATCATLTRLVGLALLPALWWEQSRKPLALLWLGLPPLAVLGLCAHLQQRVGYFWAYFMVQGQYADRFGVGAAWWQGRGMEPAHFLGLGFALCGLALFCKSWPELRPSYRLFVLFSMLMPLVHTQGLCFHRFLLVMFPLFIALEARLSDRTLPWVVVLFWVLQCLMFSFWVRGATWVY